MTSITRTAWTAGIDKNAQIFGKNNLRALHMKTMFTAFNMLTVGKQYMFTFSHKRDVRGIVCEIDKTRKWFAIYDVSTGIYEGILADRVRSCELVG
jgi:hypothetical protein